MPMDLTQKVHVYKKTVFKVHVGKQREFSKEVFLKSYVVQDRSPVAYITIMSYRSARNDCGYKTFAICTISGHLEKDAIFN